MTIKKYAITAPLFAFCILHSASYAQPSWPPTGMKGVGTMGNPWQIADTSHLRMLADFVNYDSNNANSTKDKHYILMNDLDLSVYNWTPIGSAVNPGLGSFQGNFNGNNNVIRNLTIINSTYSYGIGLFGFVKNSVSIVNLGIENCSIQTPNKQYVGGLIGTNYYGSSITISNCYVTGNVIGGSNVGGLLGDARGCVNISNCYFSGSINGEMFVGGLVGWFGGFCDGPGDGGVPNPNYKYHNSIISNCCVTGKVIGRGVSGSGTGIEGIGGIVGAFGVGTIRNCVSALDTLIYGISPAKWFFRIAELHDYYNFSPNSIEGGPVFQNNYALDSMVSQAIGPITSNLNTEYGFSIPIDSLKSFAFYNRGANWYQMPWNIQNPSGIWKICDGQDLPFLRYQGISCVNIIATTKANGIISPSGTVNVAENTNQTFTFSANTCYEVDSLWIDGKYAPDSIATGSYTFKNVTKNHTIKVSFKHLPPDTVIIRDTICYGTDYTQNGFTISNAKTDSVYFKFNTYGCDTVTRLELTVNPVYFKQIDTTICKGYVYYFAGEELTEKGIYIDTLQTISGCDSVIELTLTVISIDTTHISAEICEGESYDFFGCSLTEEDIYYETLQSIHGCDSIIELRLSVIVGIVETNNYPSLPKIYPNPTTGKLTINNEQLTINKVELFDVYGKKHISQFTFHVSPIEIDISHLASGIYFLRIDGKTLKLVKE